MLHEELKIDTVMSWSGVGATAFLWIANANTVLVCLSAILTMAFTLRKWYLMESKRKGGWKL